MRNFRPNIVVRGARPFEEDHWRRVVIGGDTELAVVKPCSRCSIVTINTATGKYSADMQPNRALKAFHARDDKPYFGQNAVQLAPSGTPLGLPPSTRPAHSPQVAWLSGCPSASPSTRRRLISLNERNPQFSSTKLDDEFFAIFVAKQLRATVHMAAKTVAAKAPGGGRTVNSDR